MYASACMDVILDTETTGFNAPDGRAGRLVQLAWVRLDRGREVETGNLLVRPDGFTIPADAVAVHGITTEQAHDEGIALQDVLDRMEAAAVGCRVLVAHNAAFDRGVLRDEWRRLGRTSPLEAYRWACTKEAGTDVCRIPNHHGWKWPTLEELHHHLFGTSVEDAHDALVDARAAARCWQRLRELDAGSDPPQRPVTRGDGQTVTFTAPPILTVREVATPATAEALPQEESAEPVTVALVAPSPDQQQVLDCLAAFLDSPTNASIVLGAAGTGKTTIVQHLAGLVRDRRRTLVVLAPTGRAARVASERTGLAARTVHSCLYVHESLTLKDNLPTRRFKRRTNADAEGVVYVVDEASMVPGTADADGGMLLFGSGSLLADLVAFVRSGTGCQLVFVGDPAQLPPVRETHSPALCATSLAEHGLTVDGPHELTEIHRHAAGGGILRAAHAVRTSIAEGDHRHLWVEVASDTASISEHDLVASYVADVTAGGPDAAVMIARTNARVSRLNREARRLLNGPDADTLVVGDRLSVVYGPPAEALGNGDLVDVLSVADYPEVRRPLGIELRWRDATVRDGSGREHDVMLLESLLDGTEGALGQQGWQALMVDFRERHDRLKEGTPAFEEALTNDRYMSALHVRYGHALTAHKAQGGEWPTAYVVFNLLNNSWRTEEAFRWTYTAMTRARTRLVGSPLPRFSVLPNSERRARMGAR